MDKKLVARREDVPRDVPTRELERVLEAAATDARRDPEVYLKETIVPAGGE